MKEEARAWLWTSLVCGGIAAVTVLALGNGAPLVLTLVTGSAFLICVGGYLSLKIISDRTPPREERRPAEDSPGSASRDLE